MHYLLLLITLIFILFLLSAFFSGSEAAITSLSKYRIKKISNIRKSSLNTILTRWLQYPQYLLTTILFGNTIVNIAISSLCTIIAIRIITPYYNNYEIIEFCTWIFVTALILIFGEIIPKIAARTYPERSTLFVIRPLNFIANLLSPITKPILFFIDKMADNPTFIPLSKLIYLSLEEVRNIISDSSKKGLLDKNTTLLLQQVLKLSKLEVKNVMIPINKIDMVDIENPVETIIDKLIETGRSRIPVYRTDKTKLCGIVLIKDLLNINCQFIENIDDYVRPAYFVIENKKVSSLLSEFRDGLSHCAITIDSKGEITGFVSLEDILEEITGEIVDEYEFEKIAVL